MAPTPDDRSKVASTSRRLFEAAAARPVLIVFLVALALRWVAAVTLGVLDLTPNPDERVFWRLGGDVAAGETGAWRSYERNVFRDGRLFVYVMALLHLLPGDSIMLGRFAAGVFGAAAAALTARIGLDLVSRRFGLVAGLVVAVWPSQIIFSATAIRDGLIWALLALIGLAAIRAYQARGRSLVAWGTLAATGLLGLAWLRPITALVAALALVLAAVVSARGARLVRIAGTCALLVVVPFAAGLGAGGANVVAPERVEALQEHRTERSGEDACTDLGHEGPATSLRAAADRFVRAAPASLIGPYPWQEVCSAWGEVAKVVAVAFAALLALAAYGVITRQVPLRRVAFLLLLIGGLTLLFGLGQDNVGTAFRHRGQLFWAVALLATAGVWRAVGDRVDAGYQASTPTER